MVSGRGGVSWMMAIGVGVTIKEGVVIDGVVIKGCGHWGGMVIGGGCGHWGVVIVVVINVRGWSVGWVWSLRWVCIMVSRSHREERREDPKGTNCGARLIYLILLETLS